MSLTIRAADLDADRDLIIHTLRQLLTPLSDATRYEWLYRGNPHGPAAAWLAVDETRGETIGMASAFPRMAVTDGREERCWVLADFCIHSDFRALGPALQLHRACLAGVDRGAAAFCYDFPSERMMAIYRRLGIRPFATMTRFAKVLRWGPKARQAVPIPGARSAAGFLGDLVDRMPSRRPSAPPGVSFSIQDRDCDATFDELDRGVRGRYRRQMDRSAAYLNWRYRANPLTRYELLTARRDGVLLGYAAWTREGPHAILADLVALDGATVDALLGELGAGTRAQGLETLSAPVLSTHPLIPHLVRAGYRPREATPVLLYEPRHATQGDRLSDADWPLLYGDRDS